jgi:hypothetical protein
VYLETDDYKKELIGSVSNVRIEGTCLKASLVLTEDVLKETEKGRA